ncbi:MAG: hypothetical protein GXW85_07025 [Clostridia bacterium]|nr:hypothetical protein [Clostridia bacterium]
MSAGFIPQEVIDEIAASADIVDIIRNYVPLKKAGRNFQGLCPFHHEKTPSFIVSPEKQIFHCFGCGVGGNVFSFIMQADGLSFPEAVQKIAQMVGVTIPENETSEEERRLRAKRERWYRINEAAAQFYHNILLKTKWGNNALAYLKKRGIDDATIHKFQLGLAPPDWSSLLEFIGKKVVKHQ